MKPEFERKSVVLDPMAGRARLEAEAGTIARIKLAALPPPQMRAAPASPARGAQQLVPGWEVLPGGTRRQDGMHWVTPSALEVMNHKDGIRRAASGEAPGPENARGKRDLFSPSQVAMARRYAELVEWRRASGLKCAKLEASHGGSDPGLFIDRFIDAGAELARLQAAIGSGWAMVPKYGRDTDNVRRPIRLRVALDAVLVQGRTLSWVLKSHHWQPKGQLRKELTTAIRGALDRMMG